MKIELILGILISIIWTFIIFIIALNHLFGFTNTNANAFLLTGYWIIPIIILGFFLEEKSK